MSVCVYKAFVYLGRMEGTSTTDKCVVMATNKVSSLAHSQASFIFVLWFVHSIIHGIQHNNTRKRKSGEKGGRPE